MPQRYFYLAQAVEKAGATLINSGIGWHEAHIPTYCHYGTEEDNLLMSLAN